MLGARQKIINTLYATGKRINLPSLARRGRGWFTVWQLTAPTTSLKRRGITLLSHWFFNLLAPYLLEQVYILILT